MTGAEFQEMRNKLGLTQAALAKVLGLSGHQAVCNIEIGFRNPSPLSVALLKVLVHLPARKSKELQDMLIEFSERATPKKKGGRK